MQGGPRAAFLFCTHETPPPCLPRAARQAAAARRLARRGTPNLNESTLAALIARAGQHPQLVLAAVALVAFAESLAVVGTFVPAAVVLFAAGVLAGHGTPPLGLTLVVAIIGAVAGDGLSYELGRHPRAASLLARATSGRGELLARVEDMIRRRGAVSVLIARFVAPVRAWVPLLAGLARMPRTRFYPVNAASAALWAPVHILPGALFGTSLRVAEAVSGRLALLLVLLAALLWFT